MPQSVLDKYLKLFEQGESHDTTPQQNDKRIGIGMDSAVIPTRHGLNLVQSVDYFYPLIDDPYVMGKIALANVVSDIYATGVTTIDKLQMIISAPTEFADAERDCVVPLIIKGFKDAAMMAKCKADVTSIAVNPWCIIGGIATSVCMPEEIIFPCNARAGDALILTKPLGTQLATNAYIWMKEQSSEWERIKVAMTDVEVTEMFNRAVDSMCLLNRTGAELMHKYGGRAATDVTGFGLLGHARNLAGFQIESLDFVINRLPIIKGVRKVAEALGRTEKLYKGLAVETSGGLLMSLPEENVEKFCEEYEKLTQFKAWRVGKVVKGDKTSMMAEDVEIIDF